MTHPLFADTVTVYSKNGDQYTRHVLKGVQWRQKIERLNDNGKIAIATVTSVTIPEGVGMATKPGNVLVLGVGPELTDEYTIARLRADNESYCTVKAVADNTRRPQLKHWKVKAV
ncbi:MAG: hypothetical protein IKL84_05380 [Clostridia bacterium]|nr:hypothetical protein [Clostridia bacterium]